MAAMPDFFDRLEHRASPNRESALFRDLRHILTVAKSRVPALRTQLKGVDVASLTSRDALARIPVLRRADLAMMQAESPPFGGACAVRPGALRQILIGPGLVAAPEGQAKDWWGAGRALYAAGLRKGAVLLNCFSGENAAFAAIAASGACAIGAPIIPLGSASTSEQVRAVARYRPSFYCGPAERLKAILDAGEAAGENVSSLRSGLVFDRLPAGLRGEFSLRGLRVRLAYATPELGLVAYETDTTEGLMVNEGLILELIEPGGRGPVVTGETGEIVVTRLNADYPLLRFGTGAVARMLPHPSSCGRTNLRLSPPVIATGDSAELCGTRVHSEQIVEIARRYPSLGRMRLVVRRAKEQDVLILRAEHRGDEASLSASLCDTLHKLTRMRGTVEFVSPGSLADDEGMIVDERPLN